MSVNYTPRLGDYTALKPFRYWCQKVLPLVYEDSLSYYELLCKVVDYLNKTMEDVETLHEEYLRLQEFVNEYFTNLDVQSEINSKLDAMAEDGSLSELIQPLFDTYKESVDSEIEGIETTLDNAIIYQNNNIKTLETRMNQFESLSDGSTTGDAELQDIRIGYNGAVYNSAGSATRNQISDLHDKVDEITESTINLANLSEVIIGKSWNNDTNSNRAVLYIEVEPSTNYTLSINNLSLFDSVSWFEKSTKDSTTSTAAYNVTNTMTKETNANTRYIVLQFNKNDVSKSDFYTVKLQVEKGSRATSYINSTTATDYVARRKIDETNDDITRIDETVDTEVERIDETIDAEVERIDDIIHSITIGANLFDINKYTENYEYTASGELVSSNVVGLSDYIQVIKDKTLYFSVNGEQIPNYRLYYVVEFDKNKVFLRRVTTATMVSYTPSDDAYYVRAEIVPSIIYTVKIEYGNVTPWTQYTNSYELANNEILATVNMFGSIAGIGDSFTAGLSADSSGNLSEMKDQSYVATLGKRAGVEWFNYGVSGATTRTYISNANGLPKVLSDNPHDLYLFALGQNDINFNTPVGSISDIHDDWTLNADTYYGNYGKIIAQIKNHAPNAKLIMIKSWLNTNKYGTEISYQSLDTAIQEIANYYYIPCIAPFDDKFFNSVNYVPYRVQGHPTTMGYSMMGVAMERLISKCIVQNPTYFLYSTVG